MSPSRQSQREPVSQYDLFADALWQYSKTGHASLRTEREDGYCRNEDLSWYLTSFREFPSHEKRALGFARGRVLDIGCGAGRHSLYLQKRGLKVTAIDVSPRLVELAQMRGVKDARVCNAGGKLAFPDGEFDTVLLFGNNLGISGTRAKFRKFLREIYRITRPEGCILATTRMPGVTNARDREYFQRSLERGRDIGQTRLRLLWGDQQGAWFDLLLFAPTDLMCDAMREKWRLTQLLPLHTLEEGYAVVMEKYA